MLLRNAFAAVLQLVRTRLGLTQHDIATTVTPSHVSQLEAVKTSPTLEVTQELAQALHLHPVSLLALVHAAQDQRTAREILQLALEELAIIELLDASLPIQPEKLSHPQAVAAEKKSEAVQELKKEGRSRAEVSQILGLPKSTVGRLWHNKNS
ncbi:helix-turn-helix domain-containing protein [Pseudomonas sp. C32]|jgi:transcriptional regulator with XRE-family HTH domain|uniref:helix-turn-helix domain-containing protein n=1 Tax=Pseudomonas sp. C32 TaxID=1529208 RepID=UPI002624BFA9|nr:helix-turn-helix domain-containing protein [Pseudomonas sp. C32]MDN4546800.1 helix-turn-helix domain-containing protein [Pseudomonas sp. C32]